MAPGRWISYSRNNNFYAARRRYLAPDITRSTVVRSVDSLAAAGLLEHQKAPAGGPTGWQSRFRATPEFLSAIEFQQPQVRHVPMEIIRLKVNGHLIDYRDTARTKAQRRHLSSINEAIGAAKLDIDVPGMVRDSNVSNNQVDSPARVARKTLYDKPMFADLCHRGPLGVIRACRSCRLDWASTVPAHFGL